MTITLLGSINDTYSRMVYQWFVTIGIEANYVEVDGVPDDLIAAGITSLPIVFVNGNYYTQGYDLEKLERLTL